MVNDAIAKTVMLFPTPVFIYDEYTDPNFVFDTFDTQKNMQPNHGGRNAISQDKYLLDDQAYSMIRQRVEKGLDVYVRDVYRINKRHHFYLTQAWLNVNPKGTYHHAHNHRNAIISGCYFIDVGDSGSISFMNWGASSMSVTNHNVFTYELDEVNCVNYTTQKIPVRNNDILFWPSSLPHYVEINETNHNRVSLAFNVFTSGDMGEDVQLDRLGLDRMILPDGQ